MSQTGENVMKRAHDMSDFAIVQDEVQVLSAVRIQKVEQMR